MTAEDRRSSETKFVVFIEDFEDDSGGLKYEHAISNMVPLNETSMVIDFNDFHAFNPEFAEGFLNNPVTQFPAFNDVLKSKLRTRDPEFAEKNDFQVRFKNLSTNTHPSQLRSHHIGKFISTEGNINLASGVKPRIVLIALKCRECGEMNYQEADEPVLRQPRYCLHCDCKANFKFIMEKSRYVDVQNFSLYVENITPLSVEITGDMIGKANVGDLVTITGIVSTKINTRKFLSGLYIRGNHIERARA